MDAEVIIVGCGPVGALAANLLGRYEVSTLVLEREASVYHLPRAAHFDGEIMRILQAVGLDAEMGAAVVSCPGMDLVNARGRPLMRFRTDHSDRPYGHPDTNMFHQPQLESVLRRGMEQYPSVTLRTLVEVDTIEDLGDSVEIAVQYRETGERSILGGKYVLGCDGARSLARKTIGAQLTDLGLHQPWLVLDLIMKRDVGLPDVALQVCDPRRPATIIPFPPPRRRWEFMLMPGDDPEEMVTRDVVRQLLLPWTSPDDYEIERAAVYTFHGLLAQPWRRGRVLLLGDAAHQTPPFLGQGMCAGIRDAFNVCWKLERVLRGAAAPALLDSYESERSPHVKEVIALAIRLGRIIQSRNRIVGALRNVGFKLTNLVGGTRLAPESVSFLPLGPGFFDESQENVAVRTPVPQPMLQREGESPRKLDEFLGTGFCLLALEHDPRRLLSADTRRSAEFAGMCLYRVSATPGGPGTLLDVSGRLSAWFKQHQANAVLLRPDRFPYGAYKAPGDVVCAPLDAAVRGVAGASSTSKEGAPA